MLGRKFNYCMQQIFSIKRKQEPRGYIINMFYFIKTLNVPAFVHLAAEPPPLQKNGIHHWLSHNQANNKINQTRVLGPSLRGEKGKEMKISEKTFITWSPFDIFEKKNSNSLFYLCLQLLVKKNNFSSSFIKIGQKMAHFQCVIM